MTSVAIGVWSEPSHLLLERGRVRSFAAAVGETDSRYYDLQRARTLGHPDLPLPLTFPFTLESDGADTLAFMTNLGIDPLRVLHGEQNLEWYGPLHAGQVVTLRHRMVRDETRSGTGLRFLGRETEVSVEGTRAVLLQATWIVRPH